MGGSEACTPKPPMISQKANLTDSKKHQTAKKIASLVKNPSALKSKIHSQLSQAKGTKPPSSTARRLIQLYVHQTSFLFLCPILNLNILNCPCGSKLQGAKDQEPYSNSEFSSGTPGDQAAKAGWRKN